MKPQLTIQDFAGSHNSDPAKTNARLLKGASWKKQRIVVILPAGDSIPAKVALSHWNLAFPPNNGVMRILAQGMEVGEAYTSAIDGVLTHDQIKDWEYLLTIEHDNMPSWDGVLRLCEAMEAHPEFACIGGLYFTKGEGGVAQIWGDINDPMPNFRPVPPDLSGGLVECYGTGMGFNMWRLSMFKDAKLRKPWFKTVTTNGVGTQDLYFWLDARQHGYRCAVDCSIKVGHYDVKEDMTW